MPNIIWIDVETTGINARSNSLLQVACLVTDKNLNILNEGYEAKVHYREDAVKDMKKITTPFVVEMHEKTNLWDALPVEGKSLNVIDDELLAEIKKYVPEPNTARLGGNSITLDRNFLQANLPKTFAHLHYRSYDISSIAGFFEMFTKVSGYQKQATHEALSDIKESIAEARYYADHLKRYREFLAGNN